MWWKLGTTDPTNPCYGYWDARDKVHTPVQFFGLSSLGPTTLEYYTFDVGPPQANLTVPNKNCHQECKEPGLMKPTVSKTLLPHFPSCDWQLEIEPSVRFHFLDWYVVILLWVLIVLVQVYTYSMPVLYADGFPTCFNKKHYCMRIWNILFHVHYQIYCMCILCVK